MTFAAGVAAAVVALIVAAGGGAAGRAERPPAGFLIGIRGTGGCVGQAGVQPGHGADYPAKDDCAAGRGLRQVHHIALSPDERFVYTAAGLIANPPDDDGAIDVFRRRADGSIMQLPGAHGCVKRPHPVEGREGCGVARGIEGARFIVLSADGRFLYAGSPTGIAIFRRDARSGTLRQLRGTAGCISQDRSQPCARAKAVNMIEDIALSADQRWAYAVANYNDAVLTFRRNPRTGTLRELDCLAEPRRPSNPATAGCRRARALDRARALTLSPDGRFAYVAGIADTVAILRRDPRTGALRQLRRRAGCVSERDVGGCTPARGLFGAHRLTLTRDGRFGYVAGKQDNTQGRRSSVAIFRRDAATGALRQLPGRAGCIMEGAADGCAPGRVIGGAHAIMLGPGERTAYLSSDRIDTGGIAIFRRDRRTGALRQLRGRFGCLAPTAADRCTPYRRTGGIHFMVRTRDGRFVYSAVENQYAVLALRAVR